MDFKKYTLDMTRVERESFLRSVLTPYVPAHNIEAIIAGDCLGEQVDKDILHTIGNECIRRRCLYAGGLSLGTSLYGGLGSFVLYPLDFAQFAYHAAKLSQELYYIFGRRDMFRYRKQDDLEALIYILAGADAAITLSGTTLGALGQLLYRKGCDKLSLKALGALPFVGGALHGSMSAYALYSLAEEYRLKLIEMNEKHQDDAVITPQAIGEVVDVEFHEAEVNLKQFCNLAKLRELYSYLADGYIDEQEFEQLKLNL